MVLVWYWLVLMWYWCGTDVVLMWDWCGTGVVLVWDWCGMVVVWYWGSVIHTAVSGVVHLGAVWYNHAYHQAL